MINGTRSPVNEAIEQKPTSGSRQPHAAHSRPDPDAGCAYVWAEAFHALRGDSTGSREEREADRERIACLEAIIAVLIEKNERIRQQLMKSMH